MLFFVTKKLYLRISFSMCAGFSSIWSAMFVVIQMDHAGPKQGIVLFSYQSCWLSLKICWYIFLLYLFMHQRIIYIFTLCLILHVSLSCRMSHAMLGTR
jgi:hypothetical protein